MLRPSYSELMEQLNREKKVDSQITSRYTIVMSAAKRARQIIDGANPLTYAPTDKAVSIAIKELSEGKLLITADPEALENPPERQASALYYQGITSVSKDDLREDFKDKYHSAGKLEDDEEDEDDYSDDIYREDEHSYKDEYPELGSELEPELEIEDIPLEDDSGDDFDDE